MKATNLTTVNLINELKSISKKDIKNWGISQIFEDDNELHIISTYYVEGELRCKIENELINKNAFELKFKVILDTNEEIDVFLYDYIKFNGNCKSYISEIEDYLRIDKELFKSIVFIKETTIEKSIN